MIKTIEIDSEFGGFYVDGDLITDLELFIITTIKLGYTVKFEIMPEMPR